MILLYLLLPCIFLYVFAVKASRLIRTKVQFNTISFIISDVRFSPLVYNPCFKPKSFVYFITSDSVKFELLYSDGSPPPLHNILLQPFFDKSKRKFFRRKKSKFGVNILFLNVQYLHFCWQSIVKCISTQIGITPESECKIFIRSKYLNILPFELFF